MRRSRRLQAFPPSLSFVFPVPALMRSPAHVLCPARMPILHRKRACSAAGFAIRTHGDRIDDALAAHFFAPRSFTGEDLVELHVHGGAGVISSCLTVVLRLGARLAAPGEFTKRAFLNGRIDLAQAEAVADLIAAESERAAKAAAHRLAGEVGASLRAVREQLLDRLVEIEAHVDYPDEVAQPDVVALGAALAMQHERVCALLSGSRGARILRDGIACVIAGPPNAGKSSLLNALLQAERAIVSEVPGTTRDVIEDRIVVDGVVLRLFDTAGLRTTSDRIEAEGVTRAGRAIDTAELVIAVIDGSQKLDANAETALEQTKDVPSDRAVQQTRSWIGWFRRARATLSRSRAGRKRRRLYRGERDVARSHRKDPTGDRYASAGAARSMRTRHSWPMRGRSRRLLGRKSRLATP